MIFLAKRLSRVGLMDATMAGSMVFLFSLMVTYFATQRISFGRGGADIVVWVLTCKHHDTFRTLNSLYASVTELFDFSITRDHFKGLYSESVTHARIILYAAYRRLAAANPLVSIRYAYVSRGDSTIIAENVRDTGRPDHRGDSPAVLVLPIANSNSLAPRN